MERWYSGNKQLRRITNHQSPVFWCLVSSNNCQIIVGSEVIKAPLTTG